MRLCDIQEKDKSREQMILDVPTRVIIFSVLLFPSNIHRRAAHRHNIQAALSAARHLRAALVYLYTLSIHVCARKNRFSWICRKKGPSTREARNRRERSIEKNIVELVRWRILRHVAVVHSDCNSVCVCTRYAEVFFFGCNFLSNWSNEWMWDVCGEGDDGGLCQTLGHSYHCTILMRNMLYTLCSGRPWFHIRGLERLKIKNHLNTGRTVRM